MIPRIFTVDIDGVIVTVVNNEIQGYVLEGNLMVDSIGMAELMHQLLSGLRINAYYAHLNLTKLFEEQLKADETAAEEIEDGAVSHEFDYPQAVMDRLQQHIAEHSTDWWMSDEECKKLEEVGAW